MRAHRAPRPTRTHPFRGVPASQRSQPSGLRSSSRAR
jgi:hypothetical protein